MFENLSKEALEKVKQAKTKEEALGILKENGIVLSDEDLAGVSGGDGCITDGICVIDCGPNFCDLVCIPLEICPENCNLDALPCVPDLK